MSTELTTITELPDLAKDMPALLTTAQQQLALCSAAVKDLAPITDEASKVAAFVLRDKIKLAATTYKEMRMPFTRKLNDIVKLFTGNENGFDGLVIDIEKKADAWATRELQKKRDIEIANEKLLKEQNAKIALEGVIREGLRSRINEMLEHIRTYTGQKVKELTKENFGETKKDLDREPRWIPETMDKFYFKADPWTNDQEMFKRIADEDFETNKTTYLTQAKQILTDSISILEVALNNRAEAERLQQAAADQAKKEAETQSTQAQADVAAQQAIASLDIVKPDPVKAKVKMKIDIIDNRAWLQMFAFWFQYDPETKDGDLSKKTLLQIKTFCENQMNTHGNMLEHESIGWVEVVKAK